MRSTNNVRIRYRSALAVLLLATVTVCGGGFKIQDQSTRAMGMSDAFVAGADDASAVYYNPAGLTHLQAPQFIDNIYFAHATTYYSGPGGSDSSDGRVYTVPNLYVGGPLPGIDGFYAGLGIYAPFGLGSRWGDDSPVRNFSTLAEIRLVNINPSLAWRCHDRLAIGVGADYYSSRIISRRINNYAAFGIPGVAGEGEVDMDAEGDGWGGNLGLQWQCTDTVTLGLTYRSAVRINYEGDVEFDSVPLLLTPAFGGARVRYGLSSDFDYPAIWAGAAAWEVSERLRIELAAEWTEWSTRDTQTVSHQVPAAVPFPSTTETDWDDAWTLMLGSEYEASERWTLRCGYGYSQTPVPGETADPSLPTGDTHVVAVGAGYRLSETASIDAAAIVGYSREQTLNNAAAPPNSDYDAISTYFSMGFTYQF